MINYGIPPVAVVAMTTGGLVALDDKIPWFYKGDLKWFKEVTMASPVDGMRPALIVGRKTYNTFPNKKPLPGRFNVVVSRSLYGDFEGGVYVGSIMAAITYCQERGYFAYVVGGGQIYGAAAPYCGSVIASIVPTPTYTADEPKSAAYFPWLDPLVWEVSSRNVHPYVPEISVVTLTNLTLK